MLVLATRVILSWLLHFSHDIGGFLLGLSPKGSSPSAVRPILSDCAMLYSEGVAIFNRPSVMNKVIQKMFIDNC